MRTRLEWVQESGPKPIRITHLSTSVLQGASESLRKWPGEGHFVPAAPGILVANHAGWRGTVVAQGCPFVVRRGTFAVLMRNITAVTQASAHTGYE